MGDLEELKSNYFHATVINHLVPKKIFKCFYHIGIWRGNAAICFGSDRIRTLVSMATDNSHRVRDNGGTRVATLAPSFLIGSSSFLHVTSTTI